MVKSNNVLYIVDLFTCDCHLAWLIRDNSNLLKAVEGGACSNGTAFNQLNPDGYNDCDSVRTSSISMESIDESSTIKPQIFSPKPPEMIKDETSETFESTTTIMASATPMATSDISNKTIATTTEISSTIEKIFATTHGAESSNLTTLLHATTVSSFTEIPEVITRDESTIPVQSGTQTSALETTTVTSSTQITRRDVTENLVGSTIETTTQIINQQKTAHTESPFTMEAEITSGTPDVSHSQMGKDTTPIPTLMDRVNTTNTSTIHEILATEENSTTLTKGNTTEVSLLNHTTERTELPSISEGTSSTMITPLTSSPLPLPSQAANVSILGRPVNSNSPLGEGLEPRTDMAEFLTNKSNIQAASELSGATEMPISFTTRLSQDNSETTIQLSETSWANNEDLTTTTKSSITNVTNLTTFESNSKTITSTTLNSSPSPTAATSNYNLTSATVAPPTAAEMNVTNIASSTSFTMTTANPTKNPANSTSHVINASVNVTYTAPSESVGHSSPTILRASGEIVKTVSSASSILPFNYLALAAVAVVNLMHH